MAKLIILWRHDGEECKNLRTVKDAEKARDQLDMEQGFKIIKMEIYK